jgi:hypothetical protein
MYSISSSFYNRLKSLKYAVVSGVVITAQFHIHILAVRWSSLWIFREDL